jgi:choline dehydrogenase
VPTRAYEYDRLASCQRAFFDACVAAGYAANGNSPSGKVSLGRANIIGTTRWNAAFAFLDPIRQLSTLTIVDDAIVDRVLLDGRCATGVVYRMEDGTQHEARARCVVLCAGTFGSAAILMRSGIGPASHLRSLGIEVALHLPGVGQDLQEHPGCALAYAVDEKAINADVAAGRFFHWQAGLTTTGPSGSRLDVFPYQSQDRTGAWDTLLMVFLLDPSSRGNIELASAAPEVNPRINPRYLSDPAARDASALAAGVHLLRRIAATEPLRQILREETAGSRNAKAEQEVEAYVRHNVIPFEHAVGTCRMGRLDDPCAVTTAEGVLAGVENIVVADASVIPLIPPVPINLTSMMIGWRLAESALGIAGAERRRNRTRTPREQA